MSTMSELDIAQRQKAVEAVRSFFPVSDSWLADLVDVIVNAYLDIADDGISGQDRESYADDQDRDNYTDSD